MAIAVIDSIAATPHAPIAPNQPLPFLNDQELTEIYVPPAELDTMGFWKASGIKLEVISKFYNETEISNSKEALDSLKYSRARYNQ